MRECCCLLQLSLSLHHRHHHHYYYHHSCFAATFDTVKHPVEREFLLAASTTTAIGVVVVTVRLFGPAFPGVDEDGDGAIVDNGHVHAGAEHAILDSVWLLVLLLVLVLLAVVGAQGVEESLVEWQSEVGLHCRVEVGLGPLAHVGVEREL